MYTYHIYTHTHTHNSKSHKHSPVTLANAAYPNTIATRGLRRGRVIYQGLVTSLRLSSHLT